MKSPIQIQTMALLLGVVLVLSTTLTFFPIASSSNQPQTLAYNNPMRVLDRRLVAQSVNPLNGYTGFGTPRIVLDPDSDQRYLFFTAWKGNSIAREVWVAPIDIYLNADLNGAKQVINPTMLGVDGVPTEDVIWDDYNRQWILFVSVYPNGDPSKPAKIVFLDTKFNFLYADNLTLDIDPGDSGFPTIVFSNRDALFSYGFGGGARRFGTIDDISARPLKIHPGVGPIPYVNFDPQMDPDVHKLFTMNGRMFMMSELTQNSKLESIRLFIGPDFGFRDTFVGGIGAIDLRGKYLMPMSSLNLIPFTDDFQIGHIGHPEYTTLTYRPALLFALFPNLDSRVSPTNYAHEIWAYFPDPDLFTNYKAMLPASIYTSPKYMNYPVFTANAGKAVFYVNVVSGSGTVHLIEGRSITEILTMTSGRIITNQNISGTGAYRFSISDPLPYATLVADPSLTVSEWGIILYP